MRRVLSDDVVIDTTASGGGVTTGADDFIEMLQQTLGGAVTVHHGHMPEIRLTSNTTATGIWAFQDTIIWPDGSRLLGLVITTSPTSWSRTSGGSRNSP